MKNEFHGDGYHPPPKLTLTWCFNWMIPNLYMKNCCFTKHQFIILIPILTGSKQRCPKTLKPGGFLTPPKNSPQGEDTEGPHATMVLQCIQNCKPQSRFLGGNCGETVQRLHHGFTTLFVKVFVCNKFEDIFWKGFFFKGMLPCFCC